MPATRAYSLVSSFNAFAFAKRAISSVCTSGCDASIIDCLAISTMWQVTIRAFKRRNDSHMSRRARFRRTARLLYFLLHMTPQRSFWSGGGLARTAKRRRPTYLTPTSRTWSKSALRRSLSCVLRVCFKPLRQDVGFAVCG